MVEADVIEVRSSSEAPQSKKSPLLEQHHDEVDSHFAMRQQVYERALSEGKAPEKAALLASVFRNCYFLGCGYPEEVMKESQKFWDQSWIEHYVRLSQS